MTDLAPTFQPPNTAPLADPWPTGDCPECGGIAIPIIGRRELAPHRQHVMRKGRVVEGEQLCDGGGGPPAEDLAVPNRKNKTTKSTTIEGNPS